MLWKAVSLAAFLMCTTAIAEAPIAKEGERPARPEGASNAAIGGWCDALTGAKKDECLRDERRRQQEKARQGQSPRGSCDVLTGPDRERCLRQSGGIEARSQGDAAGGATGREH